MTQFRLWLDADGKVQAISPLKSRRKFSKCNFVSPSWAFFYGIVTGAIAGMVLGAGLLAPISRCWL